MPEGTEAEERLAFADTCLLNNRISSFIQPADEEPEQARAASGSTKVGRELPKAG